MLGSNLSLLELNDAELVHAGLEYLRAGWRIVPVDRQRKYPLFKGWSTGVNAEALVNHIMQGASGLAEVTGVNSCVIDADSVSAASALEDEFPELRAAPKVQTGRGFHFRIEPVSALRNRINALQHLGHIDVRAGNGLALLPPTTHESGRKYRWIRDGLPIQPSQKLVQALCEKKANHSEVTSENIIHIGERNDRLFRLGCGFRGTGLKEKEIEGLLRSANYRRCEQPLTEKEVSQIVASCMKYKPNEDNTTDIEPSFEGERIMRCVEVDFRETQYGKRDILTWRDILTGGKICQYFTHFPRFPIASKAFVDYVIAFQRKPRPDRLSFAAFKNLVCWVYVKRVTPKVDAPELGDLVLSPLLDRFYVTHILQRLNEESLPEPLKRREGSYD